MFLSLTAARLPTGKEKTISPKSRILQGRADLAMAILLRLGRPDILSYIVEHGLFQVCERTSLNAHLRNTAGSTDAACQLLGCTTTAC